MTDQRRYGQWAGSPKGRPEDPTKCIQEVWRSSSWIPYQCTRKRGHGPDGLYCKQHAKKHGVISARRARNEGRSEDPTKCIQEVWRSSSWIPYPCTRKRGHGPDGLYCKQHAKRHTESAQ